MHVKFLETLDWSILIAYFLILIAIGIWASSKRKKGSSLFLAENSLRWYHIGFSMWGTNVGPSMLIASASAGFTTGIVSGNYAWYAFVFICLLAFVFAPRYLGSRITTLPEFMGKRFGQSTRNILAWYTIITILISWLALTLFAGGVPDPSGLRYSYVAIGIAVTCHLRFLHDARRTESCGLHECISNDTVDYSISHTGYHGNL